MEIRNINFYFYLNDDITSFQTGVDTIYNGCKTYGSTPTASTPTAIVNAIKAIYTNRYNAGVTAADNRANANSTNYKTGYNAGVTATKKGTATAAQVLTGYTFTNSSSVGASGTMANKTTTAQYVATGSLDSTNKRLRLKMPANGYYNTNNYLYATFSSIASLIGLTAAKIVKGNTILGIAGTAVTGTLAPSTKYLSSTTEGNISYTYTATDTEEYILVSGLNTMSINTNGSIIYTPDDSNILSPFKSYVTDRIVKLTKGQYVTPTTSNLLMITRIF